MAVKLHDYQRVAADFALSHPKCGLFLDLGLGKTLTSLSVLNDVYPYETGHILVVAGTDRDCLYTSYNDR